MWGHTCKDSWGQLVDYILLWPEAPLFFLLLRTQLIIHIHYSDWYRCSLYLTNLTRILQKLWWKIAMLWHVYAVIRIEPNDTGVHAPHHSGTSDREITITMRESNFCAQSVKCTLSTKWTSLYISPLSVVWNTGLPPDTCYLICDIVNRTRSPISLPKSRILWPSVKEEDMFLSVIWLSPLHVNWDKQWFSARRQSPILSKAYLTCARKHADCKSLWTKVSAKWLTCNDQWLLAYIILIHYI